MAALRIPTLLVVLSASTILAAGDHPFILWTEEEAGHLRQRIETDPWARREYETMPTGRDRGAEGLPRLFRYSVLGDREAGEAEKKLLLDGESRHGRYLRPLRYDILYDLLSAGERRQVEASFRSHVENAIVSMSSRRYNRWNWLPNLGYPWYLEAHLMALVLRDESLARKIFRSHHGLGWYLDEYLSDFGFYNEEFGKMYNTPDAILLWGRGSRKLGWDDIGFGYQGRQGATIRGHIESVLRIGQPSVDLGTDRAHYPRMSLGDAKGSRGFPAYGFQHYLVAGWLTDQEGGRPQSRWSLGEWSWFELAHAEWPDAGFDYFLAQRRAPDEEMYYPSLLFGLDPIDPRKVEPPPAPSGVYPGRGIVMLRAEEGPAYWESDAPAVGLRLATPYAHHIQDCFSLTGFYGFRRPLFVNHQHSSNYSGVDPAYSNSPRSHSTVIVDFAVPRTVGEVPVRSELSADVKFVAARAQGIYEDVDQTRVLMLTREYLLDAFHLESDRPRHYQWLIHALGNTCPSPAGGWTPSRDLVGSLFDLGRERSLETDDAWSVITVQSSGGANREFSGLGPRWFEERIGVKTTMLGEEGTTAYTAWAPVVWEASGQWRGRDRFAFGEDEPAGACIAAVRKKPSTTFVALHEPFRRGLRLDPLVEIGRTEDAIAVRVREHQRRFTDYLLVRFGDRARETMTLGSRGERFCFSGHAYVRVTSDKVAASGGLTALRLRTDAARPAMFLNGQEVDAAHEDGHLCYGSIGIAPPPVDAPALSIPTLAAGPLSARWLESDILTLPTGGRRSATLRLRNEGLVSISCQVVWAAGKGLAAHPAAIELASFEPGAERDIAVTLDGAAAVPNRLLRLEPRIAGTDNVDLQRAPLKVAVGVVSERSQVWPADFAETVFAPAYTAKYYYMDSTAAGLLLDPLGRRRFADTGTSYPNLVRHGVDSRGREGWHATEFPRFPYFITRLVAGKDSRPAYLYEGGRHAHGTTGGLEHWFTEDWIVCRFRDARPDERIALDWHPRGRKSLGYHILGRRDAVAEKKHPGKALVARPDLEIIEVAFSKRRRFQLEWPRDLEEIAAVYRRPAGYEYGAVELYPPDSRREKDLITQPGSSPMGFTFCLDREFVAVVKKWLASTPSGRATNEEAAAYNAAFMPHLEEP